MTRTKNNQDKANALKAQIQLRIDLANQARLGELLLDIPLSLRKNKDWVNSEYGVEAIGSPSSFTTTHPVHGHKVQELNELLLQLKKPRRKAYTPAGVKLEKLKNENTRLEESIVNIANQFVSYQSLIDEFKDEIAILKAGEQGLLEEKAELLQEIKTNNQSIRELRRETILLREKIKKYEKKGGNITHLDFESSENDR